MEPGRQSGVSRARACHRLLFGARVIGYSGEPALAGLKETMPKANDERDTKAGDTRQVAVELPRSVKTTQPRLETTRDTAAQTQMDVDA